MTGQQLVSFTLGQPPRLAMSSGPLSNLQQPQLFFGGHFNSGSGAPGSLGDFQFFCDKNQARGSGTVPGGSPFNSPPLGWQPPSAQFGQQPSEVESLYDANFFEFTSFLRSQLLLRPSNGARHHAARAGCHGTGSWPDQGLARNDHDREWSTFHLPSPGRGETGPDTDASASSPRRSHSTLPHGRVPHVRGPPRHPFARDPSDDPCFNDFQRGVQSMWCGLRNLLEDLSGHSACSWCMQSEGTGSPVAPPRSTRRSQGMPSHSQHERSGPSDVRLQPPSLSLGDGRGVSQDSPPSGTGPLRGERVRSCGTCKVQASRRSLTSRSAGVNIGPVAEGIFQRW